MTRTNRTRNRPVARGQLKQTLIISFLEDIHAITCLKAESVRMWQQKQEMQEWLRACSSSGGLQLTWTLLWKEIKGADDVLYLRAALTRWSPSPTWHHHILGFVNVIRRRWWVVPYRLLCHEGRTLAWRITKSAKRLGLRRDSQQCTDRLMVCK